MHRRQYLLAVGTATIPLIAGCSDTESDGGDGGGSDGNSDNTSENDNSASSEQESMENDNTSEGGDETESEEQEQDPANAAKGEDVEEYNGLVIQEHEVTGSEFDLSVDGIVENTSDKQKDYVEVRVRGYDSDGNQLDSYRDNTTDLQSGGTWKFSVMILDYEEFEEYDIQVSDSPF